jgi:glycosyltransferase involved in cell wall biosynthesis
MNKKKVFFNGRFLTASLSGVQRTAFEMVKAFDELIGRGIIGTEKTSFFLIYSGVIINPIELKHIHLLRRGVLKGNLWEQLELPIYTAGCLLVSLCTISTIFKTKQVVMVHDASVLVNPGYFSFSFKTWYRFAVPLLGKLSRHVITVSEFSKRELISYGGFDEKKITVIYNAAEHVLKTGEPDDAFRNKINNYKPYYLAVSSLGANKNFKGLSKAIEKMEFSKFNMLIAGGKLDALKYSFPDDHVNYLGYVSDAELKYLYRNASLFIFPSFYEGFGLPPLEAMALGCPVIASSTSSIPEILGDACDYFNPHDEADMALKIDRLIHNVECLNVLQERGYKRAALFSWEKSALKLSAIIDQYSE